MYQMAEKQAVLRLKLLLFRLEKGSWGPETVYSEWPEFKSHFHKPGWAPIAAWDGKSKETFPAEAILNLMARVVYGREPDAKAN